MRWITHAAAQLLWFTLSRLRWIKVKKNYTIKGRQYFLPKKWSGKQQQQQHTFGMMTNFTFQLFVPVNQNC